MKRFFIISLSLIVVFALCGCGAEKESESRPPEPVQAEDVYAAFDLVAVTGSHILYFRDEVTDVMYLCYNKAGGLTAMMNPETGLPLTYAAYSEMLQTYHPVESAGQSE